MKKKLLSTILVSILSISVLAGCGNAQSADAANDAGTQTNENAQEADEAQESTEAEAQDDELAAILKEGVIKVGIEGTYPPFTYHGSLAGYDVEVAQKIAESIGVEVEFVETDWDSLLAGVDSGRLDTVINDVTVTDERKEKYDFSNPYFFITRQITVKKGNPQNIHSIEDLNGKKLATNATNAYIDTYESWGLTIVPIDSSEEQADLLISGRTDVGTFNSVTMSDYLEQHPDAEIEVAFVIPDSEEQIAIPVRKGETRLLDEINKALAELDASGELKALSEKYFAADYSKSQL